MSRKHKRKFSKDSVMSQFKGLTDNEVAAKIRSTGDDFLRSPEWRQLRHKVLSHYGKQCMKCGFVPTKHPPNVDHIKPRKFYPELALEFGNLQVLCAKCNKKKGNKHETDYRYFDDGADPENLEHLKSILQS